MSKKRPGISYRRRVEAINKIYARYCHSGLSNREIWRRYVYPAYGICERAFYSILNVSPGLLENSREEDNYPKLFDDDGRPNT